MGERYTGTIKSFSVVNSYGFITCPEVAEQFNGADVYLHGTAFEFAQLDPGSISVGDTVSFEIHVSKDGKPQADKLQIQGGKGGMKGKSGTKAGGKFAGAGKTWWDAAPATWVAPAAWGAGKANSALGKANAGKAAGGKRNSELTKALQESIGPDACSTGAVASNGSPMVQISLADLNTLLREAGKIELESFCEDVPSPTDVLRGFEGTKVAGPWFSGTIEKFFPEQAFGIIDSKLFKEQFGDKELNVHADHLDPASDGNMVAKVGDEVIFPLVEDEEGNAWAWAPIIPKNKAFFATVKHWNHERGSGHLKCDTLWPVFEEDVFCHGSPAEYGGCDVTPGSPIVFNLHVSKDGKPQASSPRPPGVSIDQLPGPGGAAAPQAQAPAAKRRKVDGKGAQAVDGKGSSVYFGYVKSYNQDKGYGFITCDETFASFGRDVFLYHQVFSDGGLYIGAQVNFTIFTNAQGHPQALQAWIV